MRTTGGIDDQPVLGLDHWLCTAFENVIRLDACADFDSFAVVCLSLIAELNCRLVGGPNTELFQMTRAAPDRLHSLRRWIVSAAVVVTDRLTMTVSEVRKEALNDFAYLMARVRYRNQVQPAISVHKWADQFGDQRANAYRIMRFIAQTYFVSSEEYSQAILHIIERFGIPKRSTVIFCRWQADGRSGPRVAHEMKNQANWRVRDDQDVDLRVSPIRIVGLDRDGAHQLVLVDDFVGSGDTLSALFEGESAPIPGLLRELPRARLFLGVIVGFRDALQRLTQLAGEFRDRITLIPYRVLDETDRCFSPNSAIFPEEPDRENFKSRCIEIARRFFRGLKGADRLGYRGVGCLVVMHDVVPNNSLPVLWYDSSDWFPVFPASTVSATADARRSAGSQTLPD